MVDPKVFLGLVTHRRTRFPESAGPDGLVARVQQALHHVGVPAESSVHAEDLYDPDLVPLTKTEVIASIDAELRLEEQWRRYVADDEGGLALTTQMGLRRAYRRLRLAPPWAKGTAASPVGGSMLNRLVNIELAHLALLRQGLGSQADWVLIVEDDALLAEPDGFSVALASFVTNRSTQEQPAYVNVSRSFDSGALGLDRHLTRVGAWDSSTAMLSADRPLTNTVCAVLYRGAFLQDLVPALEAIPISPVLPIDWKLNAALLSMQASGSLGAGDCWFLDPAPIVQGSMHAPAG